MTQIMKYIKPFLAIAFAFALNSCLSLQGPYYIGDYSVHTKEAKRHDFGNDLKKLAFSLAQKLGCEISVNEGSGGVVLIGIYSKTAEADSTMPRDHIDWFNNSSSSFTVGILKNGPEETAELLRVRQCIESV